MPQWCWKHRMHTVDEVCPGCEREGTCATCRFFRRDTSDELTAPDGRCCHESEAHPLHWAKEVPETFGCNLREGKGE